MSKVADRNQRQLLELLKVPGNEICADCRSKNPRWASWDHGIFICVLCAGVHRKMGTHVSKVKSLTLDTWSREQVDHMKSRGNIVSNAELNPETANQPPPSSADEGERESQLERFIRNKYEYRSFVSSQPRRSPTPAAPPSAGPLLAKPPPQTPRRSPSPTPPPLPTRPATTPFSQPNTLADEPAPSIPARPFAAPPQSSTPSPEGKKSVRFRAASVPIPDSDVPLRVPSRAGETRPPARGILRPRSATSVAAEDSVANGGGNWSNLTGSGPASLGLGLPNGVGGGEARTASGMSTASFASMMSQGSTRSNGAAATNPFASSSSFGPSNSSPSPLTSQPQLQPTVYGQTTSATNYSPAPAPNLAPPQPQRQNSSIWDDLDTLGSVGKPTSPTPARPSSTPTFFYPSQPQQQSSPAPSNSPFDARASSPFDASPSSSTNAYTPPAPLRPQLTGFVPSSQFGQQLASELPPTSSSDSAPFLRPQQTGYHPPPAFTAQQQPSTALFYSPQPNGYNQHRSAVSTNPFQSSMLSPSPLNMSSLGQALPQVQTPMQTGGGTNPFFSGYQPQQAQTPMQAQAMGMGMGVPSGVRGYSGGPAGYGGGGVGVGGGYSPAPVMPQVTGQFAPTNPFFGFQQQQQSQQQQYGRAWGS